MAEEVKYFARTSSGLVRSVSAWDAMIHNICFMAPMAVMVYGVWSMELFSGVNLPLTALIAIPIAILCGIFYALFAAAMPRSGGDYVYVSRILNPAIGFSISFFFFVCLLSVAGAYVPWFTQWGIAPILEHLGSSGAASFISTNWMTFVVAVVIYAISAAIISRGAKATMYAFWVFFALILIGLFTYIGAMLSLGRAGFEANFDALSGMNYRAVISTAQGAGFPLHFLAGATFLGLVFTYINFLGFHASVYAGSEIKRVERSQFIAIIGATVIFGLITYIVYQVAFHTMGGQFLGSLAFLAATGDPSYTLPFAEPFLHLLFGYVTQSSAVYTAMLIGWSMMTLAAILTYIFICVRLVFAWSFDRVVPTALSKIDRRHNSPYLAVIVVSIVAIICQVLWIYTPLLSYFAYIVFGWMIMQGVTAVAAIMFPYRKRQLFETAPSVVKKMVGPLPLIVVFGIITLIISIWLGYASIMPAFGGPISPAVVAFTFGIFIVGGIIYAISVAYHRSKERIPLGLTFRELPPE